MAPVSTKRKPECQTIHAQLIAPTVNIEKEEKNWKLNHFGKRLQHIFACHIVQDVFSLSLIENIYYTRSVVVVINIC